MSEKYPIINSVYEKMRKVYGEMCENIKGVYGLKIKQDTLRLTIAIRKMKNSSGSYNWYENISINDFKYSLYIEIEEKLVGSFFKEKLLIESPNNEWFDRFLKNKCITFVPREELWGRYNNDVELYLKIAGLSECEELKKVKMQSFFQDGCKSKEKVKIIRGMFDGYIEKALIELNHQIDKYLKEECDEFVQ